MSSEQLILREGSVLSFGRCRKARFPLFFFSEGRLQGYREKPVHVFIFLTGHEYEVK
ncbi:hypothetical protein CLOM621_08632 [Clostridium sp. M62/1]|nr:hypothetical protein CLOM621_08632 [Clostridium sp. M62/1]